MGTEEKIVVVDNGFLDERHKKLMASGLSEFELKFVDRTVSAQELEQADIILGNPSPRKIAGCKNLKLLQLFSAGTDGYVENLPKGTKLANATGAYGLAISEHMLAVMLCLTKNLHKYGRNQLEGKWQDEGKVSAIQDSVCLVVGLGDIGGEFAKRMKALGSKTIGVRRAGTEKPEYVDELYLTQDLDKLLPQADVVALCLPNTPQTTGIMNAERIALMKKGSVLLNVGRGTAVDQTALIAALERGEIAGVGLDVTNPEPLPSDDPLWHAPNVIITPHVSGANHLSATYDKITRIVVENVYAIINHQPIANEIDLSTGYRALK